MGKPLGDVLDGMRNAGRVMIGYRALGKLLQLKSGQRITAIVPQTAEDVIYGHFSVIVEGEGMPDLNEGWAIPIVTVEIKERVQS